MTRHELKQLFTHRCKPIHGDTSEGKRRCNQKWNIYNKGLAINTSSDVFSQNSEMLHTIKPFLPMAVLFNTFRSTILIITMSSRTTTAQYMNWLSQIIWTKTKLFSLCHHLWCQHKIKRKSTYMFGYTMHDEECQKLILTSVKCNFSKNTNVLLLLNQNLFCPWTSNNWSVKKHMGLFGLAYTELIY